MNKFRMIYNNYEEIIIICKPVVTFILEAVIKLIISVTVFTLIL